MNAKVRDVLERVVRTASYAFVAALPLTLELSGDALAGAGWAGLTAAITATLSLLKNLVADPALTASGNIFERVAWTAVQAFLGSMPATFALTLEDGRALVLAGVTAAVSAVLSLAKNLTAEGAVIEATRRFAGGGQHAADIDRSRAA